MKHMKHLTAAALALLMTASLCGCGQEPERIPENAENSSVQEGSADKDAPPDLVIGDEMTIGIGPMTASPGQKKVPVNIQIWNNTGFIACGIKIGFDPALTPVANGNYSQISEIPEAEMDKGEVTQGFLTSCLIGEQKHVVAFGCMNTEPAAADGIIFTCYFDIPDDAPIGTEYRFTCEMDSLSDEQSQPLTCQTADGILKIE